MKKILTVCCVVLYVLSCAAYAQLDITPGTRLDLPPDPLTVPASRDPGTSPTLGA